MPNSHTSFIREQTGRSVAPAPFTAFQMFDDVDEGANCFTSWNMRYDQISPGKLLGQIREVRFRDVRIFWEVTNQMIRQTCCFPAKLKVFGVPMRMEGEAVFFGRRAGLDALLVAPAMLDFRSAPLLDLMTVAVDIDKLGHAAHDMSRIEPQAMFRNPLCLQSPPGALSKLRDILLSVFHTLDQEPTLFGSEAVQKNIEDALTLALIELSPDFPTVDEFKTAERRRRLVEAACSYALSNREDPVSILDICRTFGASRRKLNYCFQEVLGLRPIQYLRALRLNGVRRDLKAAGCEGKAVQDVAARWGFWHLSQFSADYRAMFGERPSDTLRRNSPIL